MRRAPLTVRLALLVGILTAAVVAAAFFAVSLGTRARTREVLAEQLRAHQRAVLGLQRQTLQQVLITSALIGDMPTLRAAMRTYREEAAGGGRPRAVLLRTIQTAIDSIATDVPQALLIITDDQGRVLWASDRAGPAPPSGEDLSGIPAVRDALDGGQPTLESSVAIVPFHDVNFQLGSVPMIQNGSLIGVLLLGDPLDSVAASRLKGNVGSEVVIRSDQRVLSSSVAGIDGAGLAAAAGRGTVDYGGQTYVVASLPIGRDAAGRPVTLDLLRSLTATTAALQQALTRNFLLYGLLAVMLATLAAAMAARSELHSFGDFVRFMGAVAESRDYSRRFVDAQPTREMQTLTEAYGQLITSLAEHSAALVRANTELRQEVEERERAEQTLRERDEQLRQSQKLEAVGTLAGGVAHDFNNLLTVIHSYTELIMAQVGRDHTMYPDLEQIRQAANRAGRLTSQLLAFSRKQVMQPRVLDLGSAVGGVEKMLRRLIGENIELITTIDGHLARIKADPGQIEQVVVNLVVNARDALPRGGRLEVAVYNQVIRSPDPGVYGDTPTGRWVVLSVTDNGTGMNAETMRRIFEPFFTTKDVGKGTGLGLAMVYGIVKQSGGHIHVSSTPGSGSKFTIYLPALDSAENEAAGTEPAPRPLAGTETVLLVEDEEMVRKLGERTLRGHGYEVLSAPTGAVALELLEQHGGRVQLLLTDVVMPQMSGKELAEVVSRRCPGIKVLYMSGYTEDTIVHHGVLETGVALLQKPFTPSGMARRVREILDASPA